MAKITDKQKAFVDEYMIDLNATRAYKIVYKTVKSDEVAAAASTRLLRNVKVKEYLERRMKDREKRTEITQDKVLAELAKIAFANGSDFAKVIQKTYKKELLDPETNAVLEVKEIHYTAVDVMPTDQVPKDKLAAIAGIKSTKEGIEVKMNDKVKALELIGRHLGMFNDKLDINANVNHSKLDSILQQLEDDTT